MNINYLAPCNSETGYGLASTYILKYLTLAGHDVSLFPIGGMSADTPEDLELIKQRKKRAQLYDGRAPSLRLYHQFALDQHVGRGPHVGFPIFELDQFNKVEKHHIEQQDMLFVCSGWAELVVQARTNQKNTKVVPLGFDSNLQNVQPSSEHVRNSGTECVFLNIGKWEYRKGHDILWKAFDAAFQTSDRVELWMMCDNIFYSQDENDLWNHRYRSSKMGMAGKVKIFPRVKTHAEVISVMKQADVGVWPARAEGWNMELLEMMAIGKPVISTYYSAPTEFITTSNCNIIPIDTYEDAKDGKWFFGQGKWASLKGPPYDFLVQTLRDIYKSGKFRNTNHNGILTGRKFSWANTANKITQYLT